MAAKRCGLHAINYPANYNRCLVDGCYEELKFFAYDQPDEDFKDVAAYHSHMSKDNAAEGVIVGPRLIHADCVHLGEAAIADVQQNIAHYADQSWIAHEELIKAGYLYLEDFQVVMVQGKFYELQAHIGRATLTHGIRGGVWWIEEIDPNVPCPDYIPEGGD